MLLYLLPPVCGVCPNYEVVVFQPQTLIPPHIGYRCLTLHFNLAVPPHLFLLLFMYHSFPPLSYRLSIRILSSLKPSRFTRSPPPLPVQSAAHLGVDLTRHPSDFAACPCAQCLVPASATVSRAGALPPPLVIFYAFDVTSYNSHSCIYT